MKKNYKIQITNYNVQNYKENGVFERNQTFIINTKGSHGLQKDSLKLQTMTAFNQKLLQMLHGSRCFTGHVSRFL